MEQVPKLMTALGLEQGELIRAATGPPGEGEVPFTVLLEQLSALLTAETAPGEKLPAEPSLDAEAAVELHDVQDSILMLSSLGGLIQGNPELFQELGPEAQEALKDGLLDLSPAQTPAEAAGTIQTSEKQLRILQTSREGKTAQEAPGETVVETRPTAGESTPIKGENLPNPSAGTSPGSKSAGRSHSRDLLSGSQKHPAPAPAESGAAAVQGEGTPVQRSQQQGQALNPDTPSPPGSIPKDHNQAGDGPERAAQQPPDRSNGHQSQAAGSQQPVEPAQAEQPGLNQAGFNQAGLQPGASEAKNPSGMDPAGPDRQVNREIPGAETEPQSSAPDPVPSALPDLKTAQTGRTARSSAAEPVRELPQTIIKMIEHGEDHLKLQLRPSRMGEMEINISRGEQGLSIALQTDSENTAQLLKGHLDELKSSLARSGVQLQDLNVNQGSQQEAHAFRQPNRPAAAHPEQTAEPETASQPLRYREDNSVEYLI